MSDLKGRLRQARKLQNMTMTAFARSLGITYNVLANYELGRVQPTDLFLRHLCSTYGISRYWLETGEGDPYRQEETLDDVCAQLRVVLAGMDPYKVDTIIKLVRMPDSWWQQLKQDG